MKQPNKKDFAYLWEILNAAKNISFFINGILYRDYLEDAKTRSAVERQLEIIGEASKKISEEFRISENKIPWKLMIGQRNILAHEYGAVDDDLIWETASNDIPELIKIISLYLP